jgi:glycosyltransferase involved in cell wall biosynthesis
MLGGLLTQADVLVSPRSQGTNTPMKLYSYMASGTAIAATDRLTHTQVLTHDTAVLADPTPEAYGAGLRSLLESEDVRKRLSGSALEAVNTTYSMDNFTRTVRSILDVVP